MKRLIILALTLLTLAGCDAGKSGGPLCYVLIVPCFVQAHPSDAM